MATDRGLLKELTLMAFKIETTTGTAIALAGADAAVNTFNSSVVPEVGYIERRGSGASLSMLPGAIGPKGCTIEFDTELVGLGSAGLPAWTALLSAAGMTATSQTYSVISPPDVTTITCAQYADGWKIYGSGVKMNCVLTGEVGKQVMAKWTGKGCWQDPAAVSMLAPTFPTVIPPVLESATFTIGGTSYRIGGFTLDLGNNVVLRKDITAASGYHAAYITSRKPTFKCAVERVAAGTKNWYTDFTAGTTAALNLVVGGTTNNIITIAAPAMQLTNVKQADDNGIQQDELEFNLVRSANAGDDELTIALS